MPKHDYRIVLGKAIRKKRMRLRFTQKRLAEQTELTPNYIGLLERGEETVSMAALVRIAKALRTRVRVLLRNI
jgi:transcriptional regulator with XRE-family HTH domain